MARFVASEAEHYGGQGGGGFLKLSNDGDTAQVRFMYNGMDDVEGMSVHEIKKTVNGESKKQFVNCLREYRKPITDCPFCAAGMPVQAKLFIPVYDVESGTTKTWQRGKTFFGRMSSICRRFSSKDKPLVSHIFEIERNGVAGDRGTTYEVCEISDDDTTLEDLPEAPTLDGLVWDKTAEDMEYYLQEKHFPPTDDEDDGDEEEVPVRRRDAGRRTPANSRRREF